MDLLELIVLYAFWLRAKGHINGIDIMCQGDDFKRWIQIFNEYPTNWKIAQFKRFFTEENPFDKQQFIA